MTLFPDLPMSPDAAPGSDVAYTPDAVTRACVAYLMAGGGIPGTWWEPAAGGSGGRHQPTVHLCGPTAAGVPCDPDLRSGLLSGAPKLDCCAREAARGAP